MNKGIKCPFCGARIECRRRTCEECGRNLPEALIMQLGDEPEEKPLSSNARPHISIDHLENDTGKDVILTQITPQEYS